MLFRNIYMTVHNDESKLFQQLVRNRRYRINYHLTIRPFGNVYETEKLSDVRFNAVCNFTNRLFLNETITDTTMVFVFGFWVVENCCESRNRFKQCTHHHCSKYPHLLVYEILLTEKMLFEKKKTRHIFVKLIASSQQS